METGQFTCIPIIKNRKTANEANLDCVEQGNFKKHPDSKPTQEIQHFPENGKTKSSSKGKDKKNKTIWRKGIECLRHLYYKCLCPRQEKVYLIIRQKDLLASIEKLRKQNSVDSHLLPPMKDNRKTLVIDLEGVFIDSSRHKIKKYDFAVYFDHRASEIKMYCKIRPGTQAFLEKMAKIYEVILFTSCQREYANGILNKISKPGQIKHKLYREKCLNLNLVYYLKQMRKLGRDPKNVIFIDCNVATGVLQPLNFLMVKRYHHHLPDQELTHIAKFLQWLSKKEAATPVFKNYEQYLIEQICFKNGPETNQQDSKLQVLNRQTRLNFPRIFCEHQKEAIQNQSARKEMENQVGNPYDFPQNCNNKNENQHTTTESSLIQGEHPVNPKNIKIEKIVASKRIFSKIELSLEKIEANKYEGKLEHRICYQFEKEKQSDTEGKEKLKRISSQTPLVQIMKKMLWEEARKNRQIIQTTP